MLAVASVCVFLSGPAQTYGVSVFVDPMLAEFGWSRSLFSTAYAAGTLVSAATVVFVGRQIDLRGNRLILIVTSAGFAVALTVLSITNGVVALVVGFSLLRAFGSGVLVLAARTLIPNWFRSRPGRAFSILGIAGMLSQAAIPPYNEALIGAFGWRGAFRVNSVLMLAVLLPLVALVVRNRPEDIGQRPDGASLDSDIAPSLDDDGSLTIRAALRTRSFWALIFGGIVPPLVITGLSLNQVAIMAERGLPRSLAATAFTVEAAVALPVTLLVGWLADRFPLRYSLAVSQCCLAMGMLILLSAGTTTSALVYIAWRGASVALWVVAADVAWPVCFGRRYLGTIRGIGFAAGVAGAALGPVFFGIGFDRSGSYDPVITVMLILPIIAALGSLLVRPLPRAS